MNKVYIKSLDEIEMRADFPKLFLHYFERFTSEKRLLSTKKAYSLLLNVLEQDLNLDIKNEGLDLNEYNKPYLHINSNIYFNISHSKDMVALVISDKECGIDIEYINKDINTNVIKKYLSNKEMEIFNKSDEKINYLFKMWTVKEAYFKSIGVGIFQSQLKEDLDFSNIKSEIISNKDEKYYVSIDM